MSAVVIAATCGVGAGVKGKEGMKVEWEMHVGMREG